MAFAPDLAGKAQDSKRTILKHFQTGTTKFLVSLAEPAALLGPSTLLSGTRTSFRNRLRNRFCSFWNQERTASTRRLAGSEVFSSGPGFGGERLPGVELLQMDARKIPFADEFDVIGAFDVLEHIARMNWCSRKCIRPHAKEVAFFSRFHNTTFFGVTIDEYSHHVRRYSAAEL